MFLLELKNAFKNKFANVLFDEPMKKHTTFKIGGNADVFIIPNDSGEIIDAIKLCEEFKAPFYIIGNGSNILVGDGGINGVVIQIFKNMGNIGVNGNIIKAEGGALLSLISRKALEEGLTGLEFASGIPGTVGGGVCMNAGAYGGEMKDIISKVVVLKNGEILELSNEESEFEYRNSCILKNGMIVLEAEMVLQKGKADEIKEKMFEFNRLRSEKQPLEFPSAGSAFKRPEGYFAGKLIMDSGLRGYSVGGASVSEKHCGFIINKGNATAKDVITLIEDVKRIVNDKFGVMLKPEIRFIGNF
ncbi:MAG: UDP-N-acetylmuramate dehydrogenase [Clostridiales bacterium]|nr:UDP-N-acetylmuramate dehydrogenase [Clostridiales bacterium]